MIKKKHFKNIKFTLFVLQEGEVHRNIGSCFILVTNIEIIIFIIIIIIIIFFNNITKSSHGFSSSLPFPPQKKINIVPFVWFYGNHKHIKDLKILFIPLFNLYFSYTLYDISQMLVACVVLSGIFFYKSFKYFNTYFYN